MTMRYKLLGRSGLRVSELSLGTMTFGSTWGWGADDAESRRQFEAFAQAGGNFIDTANRYTEGNSERILSDLIAPDRDHWVIATKYTLWDRRDDPNFSGNQRKNMIRSIEGSLKRLKTDHIDLFYVHAWDGTTPIEEIMRGLDDLVRAGKVLYVGISDTPAWIISRANLLADLRGWSAFVGVQLKYSLIERTPERDLLPMARALDLAVLVWSAIGTGVLTGKYNDPANSEARRLDKVSDRDLAIAAVCVDVARQLGHTPSQVALNWVRQQAGHHTAPIIPIIGARTLAQLEDNLGCLNFTLPPDALTTLNEASAIPMGFPHDFLDRDFFRDIASGGTHGLIDNHRIV